MSSKSILLLRYIFLSTMIFSSNAKYQKIWLYFKTMFFFSLSVVVDGQLRSILSDYNGTPTASSTCWLQAYQTTQAKSIKYLWLCKPYTYPTFKKPNWIKTTWHRTYVMSIRMSRWAEMIRYHNRIVTLDFHRLPRLVYDWESRNGSIGWIKDVKHVCSSSYSTT